MPHCSFWCRCTRRTQQRPLLCHNSSSIAWQFSYCNNCRLRIPNESTHIAASDGILNLLMKFWNFSLFFKKRFFKFVFSKQTRNMITTLWFFLKNTSFKKNFFFNLLKIYFYDIVRSNNLAFLQCIVELSLKILPSAIHPYTNIIELKTVYFEISDSSVVQFVFIGLLHK